MTVLVYCVGALLVLAGAVFIAMGVPIVRLELGWSEIIGGAVAGSAGFVVLSLGVVVSRLEDLRRAVLGMNVTAALRDSFVEPDPEPAWEEPSERRFAPHPLAPVPAPSPAAFAAPVPVATPLEEPQVEPEPPLAEAPLHPAEPEPIEDLPPLRSTVAPSAPPPAPTLSAGAPALQPDEEHAPPLRPVEAVPPDTLAEVAADPEPEPPPPPPVVIAPPADAGRTRPNFLATFLARRSAAGSLVNRMTPPRERPPVEPPLMPRRQLDEGEPPARTSVDLSSGWGAIEPPHHAPGAMADDPVPVVPPPSAEPEIAPIEHIKDEPVRDEPPREEPVAAAPPVAEPMEPTPAPPPLFDPEPEAEPEPLQPVIVGRYNAGSASYIMYSNGMIEVETETGTHQFASMQDLKAFIERRDAAKV